MTTRPLNDAELHVNNNKTKSLSLFIRYNRMTVKLNLRHYFSLQVVENYTNKKKTYKRNHSTDKSRQRVKISTSNKGITTQYSQETHKTHC